MKQRIGAQMVAMLLALGATSALAQTPGALRVPAITKAYKDVTMTFARPVQVSEVAVKEGQDVKAGQLLVQFDNREETADYNKAKADAANMTKIEVQQAVRDQAEVHYKKLAAVAAQGAVAPFELDEAKIQVTVETARLDMEKFNYDQLQLVLAQKKAALEKMALLSPIDGRVEKIYLEVGESVDSANAKVIHVAQRNPLRVEGNVPFTLGLTLHKGDEATVIFSDKSTATGKVTYVAGVADPASSTLRVTVQVPNPDMRPAGEQVEISFAGNGRLAQRP